MKEFSTLDDLKNWQETTTTVDPPIRLGVLGDPVEHSLSPQMQNAALRERKIDVQYAPFHIRADELPEALALVRSNDFIGVNLTTPHKIAAVSLMDEVDDAARKIGAINTVLVEGERFRGFNTDGPGFLRAIRNEFSVDLRDLRIMLLGAGGGAGRSIAMQCALENCERLVLVNRTLEKAQELAKELTPFFVGPRVLGPVARIQAIPWENSALRFQIENTDLIVNASPVGMNRNDPTPLPAHLLAPHLMVYDTIYTSMRTPLLAAAVEVGARAANGRSMLLYQGALSFEIWFSREAPIDAMRKAFGRGD